MTAPRALLRDFQTEAERFDWSDMRGALLTGAAEARRTARSCRALAAKDPSPEYQSYWLKEAERHERRADDYTRDAEMFDD